MVSRRRRHVTACRATWGSTRVGSRKGKDQARAGGITVVSMGKGKLSQGEKLESSQWALGCRAISRCLIPGIIMGNEFCLLKPKSQTEEGPWALDSFTCMLEVCWQGNHVPSLRTGLLWEGQSFLVQRGPRCWSIKNIENKKKLKGKKKKNQWFRGKRGLNT